MYKSWSSTGSPPHQVLKRFNFMRKLEWRIIALAPGGLDGARLVTAAGRAGALGVLDLTWLAGSAMTQLLGKEFDRPFGIRINPCFLAKSSLAFSHELLHVMIVVEAPSIDWAATLGAIRRLGRTALAEVTSRESAQLAADSGFDGLILAGREAGGRVGEGSCIVLLQAVLGHSRLPIWVRGGIGPSTATTWIEAGASGVVLDGALLLARESPLLETVRSQISRWDGVETNLVGGVGMGWIHVGSAPGSPAIPRLRAASMGSLADWDSAVSEWVGWGTRQAWPVGQDGALAAGLASHHVRAGGIIRAVEAAIDQPPRKPHRPFAVGLPSEVVAFEKQSGVAQRPSDIAIVGMSAILPGAGDVRTFWENTLKGVDAITEIPPDRWDWRTYYDADPKAPDKVISKWGGFLPDVPFDPLRYGMPPSSLTSIEPVQLLLLEATRAAIDDAGYTNRPFDRERTAVVLGMGGGAAQLAMGYAFRSYLPMLNAVQDGAGTEALKACEGLLPEWTEDSFPGFLLNVAAGRVANRFDLGGANYTVDAACGSSLAAAALAVRELEAGSADVVLLGGADTVQNPFTYLAFSKTHAFSPRGRCRPFDASADGIVISEGVAMVVLKRLADAERDGDRIYTVIKGVGASSDGRAKGLTAPSAEGQVRAVGRAYAKAGVDPATVGYVEAHGTGTAVGDVVEVNSISRVFREAGVPAGSVAIGSVKSMIGHTKCAAGLAGLINASLALHHKILPPTIGVEAINPKTDLLDGPFRVSASVRPWIHDGDNRPRRAGVSAFGFGGTNFHAVLEAYEGNLTPDPAPSREWPAELFAWRASGPEPLLAAIDPIVRAFDGGARPKLRDLARAVSEANPPTDHNSATLAIVAVTLDDLISKLRSARSAIASGETQIGNPAGTYFAKVPRFRGEPVAFLFPGQGSQSPGMLADLAMTFPEVRGAFDEVDAALKADGRPTIGRLVFPDSMGLDDAHQTASLRSTDAAQPALGAAAVGLVRLLERLGVEPDVVAGHSFGELVALHAAGALTTARLAILAHERGRLMLESLGDEPGSMAAVSACAGDVERLIEGLVGVVAVNENGPSQTVIAGPSAGIEEALARATRAGFRATPLAVAGAFHTQKVAGASELLARAAAKLLGPAPDRPVFANLDAGPHPDDLSAIAERLGRHVASPVRFASMIGAMHEAGARVFVEVGPGSVLAPLVDSILEGRPHLAVSCEPPGKAGIEGLLRTLARLVAAGLPARLDRLTLGRSDRILDLARLPVGDGSTPPTATTWLVNGSRSRPIAKPEPRRLGQAGIVPTPKASRKAVQEAPTPPVQRNGSTNGHHSNGHPTTGKAMTPPLPSNHSRPSNAPASPDGPADERVLASFQETMRAFLEVQRSTMLAYLAGRPGSVPSGQASSPPHDPHPSRISPAAFERPTVEPKVHREPMPTPSPPSASIVPQASPPAPAPLSTPATIAVESFGATATEGVDREAVSARLVEIVRDRTGYPSEMLGLDLDLEADLGIDSIKRVEILGTLRDAVPSLAESADSTVMDALSRARTLGEIAEMVVEMAQKRQAGEKPDAATASKSTAKFPAHPVRRMVLEVVPAPLPEGRPGLIEGGVVVVTDDGTGVARGVAAELEAAGHAVILAGPDEVDFSSPSSVDGLLDLARSSGEVAAIVHALPLRNLTPAGLDRAAWSARMGPEVKGLFLLAKAAAEDLERASRRGGGALVAATSMGGGYGSGPSSARDFFPGHGGVAGLVKTLAREWPGVRARVIDFDPRDGAGEIAVRLASEVFSDDGWAEVGYLKSRRVRLQGVVSPLDPTIGSNLELRPGEPIVVTGGARGITAHLVLELARRWKPTLLLLGRNPLPSTSESPETAGIEAEADLKVALLVGLRRGGRPVTPADLERAYQGVEQAREIRRNLEALRSAGATVDYAPVDVRDGAALARVLDGWRLRHGEPVGLVHGAGVIKDKLIRDKTPESFDHVLGTKLDGILNLAGLLKPESIRFAALFSSIAGRFGNVGQSDYAAANETLNKLALWLDRRWAGRVVSMIWGPWSGVGMVSELEGHLGGQGLQMITPESGRLLLSDELRFGPKGAVEVIEAGELGTLADPFAPARIEEFVR